jgi:hypothetical protein
LRHLAIKVICSAGEKTDSKFLADARSCASYQAEQHDEINVPDMKLPTRRQSHKCFIVTSILHEVRLVTI